jgi:hypothetical protein
LPPPPPPRELVLVSELAEGTTAAIANVKWIVLQKEEDRKCCARSDVIVLADLKEKKRGKTCDVD